MESSAINASHPDDKGEEEDFFGGEDEEATEPVVEDEPTAEGTEEPQAATDAPGADERAVETEERGKEEDGADPTPPAESAGPTEPDPATDEPPADPPADGKKGGEQVREYIVFQKLALTERVLKILLAQFETGDSPEPRVAFFELAREVARNDKTAVGSVYRANKDALGDHADMAAVSSRSFKERAVQPRERRVASDVEIV